MGSLQDEVLEFVRKMSPVSAKEVSQGTDRRYSDILIALRCLKKWGLVDKEDPYDKYSSWIYKGKK